MSTYPTPESVRTDIEAFEGDETIQWCLVLVAKALLGPWLELE